MERIPEVMALLRAARALLNLHQEQVADIAGVSRQTIARIENESGTIPVETIEKVRNALEKRGVMFLPSSAECGPAVGLRKNASRRRSE
ncbi:MAG: helix-turn-helix transcriptional regulator [Rhizobiales bacterium]|nr:helix-turn-helix transcriptional regulator [Hyphomicrobiales bacterium]